MRCLAPVLVVSVLFFAAAPAQARPCSGSGQWSALGCAWYTLIMVIPSAAVPELSVVLHPDSGAASPGVQWEFPVQVYAEDWGPMLGAVTVYGSVSYHPDTEAVFGRLGARLLLDFDVWVMPYVDGGAVFTDGARGPRVGGGLLFGKFGVGFYTGAVYEPLFSDLGRSDQVEVHFGFTAPLMF